MPRRKKRVGGMRKLKLSEKNKKQDNKILFAFLATFLSIIGFIIAIIVKRDDKYVIYYAKQSLIIFIIGAVAGAFGRMIIWIPIMGPLMNFALIVLVFIACFSCWIYALSEEEK